MSWTRDLCLNRKSARILQQLHCVSELIASWRKLRVEWCLKNSWDGPNTRTAPSPTLGCYSSSRLELRDDLTGRKRPAVTPTRLPFPSNQAYTAA
eukprot:1756628-Rhodomonas_salina.2